MVGFSSCSIGAMWARTAWIDSWSLAYSVNTGQGPRVCVTSPAEAVVREGGGGLSIAKHSAIVVITPTYIISFLVECRLLEK